MAIVTIDNSPPTSSVNSLPTIETNANFLVCWSGTDLGSGIVRYDVYVNTNGGPWALWQASIPNTCATFTGQNGQTYRFYSVAHDGVDNVETPPTDAEALTTVQAATVPVI